VTAAGSWLRPVSVQRGGAVAGGQLWSKLVGRRSRVVLASRVVEVPPLSYDLHSNDNLSLSIPVFARRYMNTKFASRASSAQ